MEENELPLDVLANKLRVIQDLRDKLVHVKWNRESLRLLNTIVRDTVAFARDFKSLEAIAEHAEQLQRQTDKCLASKKLPQGEEREQLIALLDDLRHAWTWSNATTEKAQEPQRLAPPSDEILLVATASMGRLTSKLENSGFRVRHIDSLSEARLKLIRATPAAVIVDADCGEEPLAGIGMVAKLRERFGLLRAPVFFVSERSDLAARMEAVAAGGAGYFTKPVNVAALVEKLNDQLLYGSARGCRVLIVDDNSAEARQMASVLEAKGIITQVITQPAQIFQSIYRFQPNLLILDLDLKEIEGVELANAVRQHEACEGIPLLLLSYQYDLSRHLAALGAGGGDLLGKPLAADYLLSAVAYRLRKAQMLYHKFSNLNHRDAISGLYNRRYFLHRLEQTINTPGRQNSPVAIMLITLDNLRAVETTDLSIADEMVEQAARRLQSALYSNQKVARFGAAIFAVLIESADQEALLATAQAVRNALENKSYETDGGEVRLQVSIGISIASDQIQDFLTVVQHADLACSIARETGGDHVHIYDSDVDQDHALSHQRRLVKEIREAVELQRMSLMFQPIVNLRGDHTERYEVFLRMHNKRGQELLPETVFGIAQKHRLGVVLDRWVIASAIRLLQERQASDRSTTFFINVSPALLRDDEIIAWLKSRLEKTGVYAKSLVFELPEAAVAQRPMPWHQFADAINSLGCGLALDRFGKDGQSRALFRELPIGYVKLDGQFVHELVGSVGNQRALRQLVQGFADLEISTIVGGVEDLPTLQALWSCGIAYVQGFLLQRPHEKMDYTFEDGMAN